MKQLKHEKSNTKTIYQELDKMHLGESFSKEEFILTMYDYYDYYIDRSFSVLFANAKKLLPEKKFTTVEKKIIRIL